MSTMAKTIGAPVRLGRVSPRTPARASATVRMALATIALLIAGGLIADVASAPAPQHGVRSHGGLARVPAAARGVVSATLGAADSRYRVYRVRSGLGARNSAQRVTIEFARTGIDVRAPGATLGLGLASIAFDGRTVPLGPATPRGTANRVVYSHPGVSEWYANGPLGLEQGFAVAAGRGGHAARVTLGMAISGHVSAKLAPGGRSVTFAGRGGARLRYGDLVALDAAGRQLPSRLTVRHRQLLLSVDARGARYPLRIDPLIQQGSKLLATDESGEGGVGESVALSADGNTALVGGPYDIPGFKLNQGLGVGAAWVFVRNGGVWTQQGPKLVGKGEIGNGEFGSAVALSADGNTAVVGAPADNEYVGAAWIFTRSGTTWSEQSGKLTGAGTVGKAFFGVSTALSADGNTAMIGGSVDNAVKGAVWVFTRSGATWSPQGPKLTPSDESGAGMVGSSVALSADGNTSLIGGDDDANEGKGGPGAAWVFTRSGSTWTQQGPKLTGGGEVGPASFGRGGALSQDGNTALIGGPGDNGSIGAAWVFTRTGTTWEQQGPKLTANDESGPGYIAQGVALSADGNTALIGSEKDNEEVGAAWVFTRSGASWTQQGSKLTGTGEVGTGGFGNAVALSSDAATALVGARGDNEYVGAAFVFVPFVPPVTPVTPVGKPAAPVSTAPKIAGLAQSHRVWREGAQLASIARAHKRPPVGTTFSFTLDQQASVGLVFRRVVAGRRVHGRCVAPSRRNRSAKACTRTLAAGSLVLGGHAGLNRVKFAGRLSRSKRLPPGRYTVSVSATNAARQRSAAAALSFTITP